MAKTKQKTKKKSALDDLVKIIYEQRKWEDFKLRYSSEYVIDYVEKACKDNYFVEAYCIAQQYIILSIEKIFPGFKKHLRNRKISEYYLVAFLNGIGFLSNELFSKWRKLIYERNDMAHDLIDNPKKIEELSKKDKKEIIKFLVGCVESADEFFIDTFRRLRINPKDSRFTYLVKIALRRVEKAREDFLELTKGKIEKLMLKEVMRMLENKRT